MKTTLRSFNPLLCRSESLPANIVLMVKLIAFGLILKDYVHDLSDHFLPFWPIFDHLGSPQVFKAILQFFFVVGVFGVLFNRSIRFSCLILGLVFGVAVLSSKTGYTNVKFFCSCLFFLTALSNAKDPLVLFRYQMAIVYFGAWVNKVFDVDWRSGQYFEHWITNIIKRESYVTAASHFPPMFLSKVMSWSSIITEIFISVGYLLRPLQHLTILAGVYFHSMVFLLAWYDFRVFSIAILSSYLILVRWPETMTVRYDSGNRLHSWVKFIFEKIDLDKRMEWQVARGGLELETFGTSCRGVLALKRLILYSPFFYFCYVFILGLPNDPFLWIKLKAVQLVLILFFPLPEIWECFKAKTQKR